MLPGIGCGDGWVVRYLFPLLHRRKRGRLAARVKVDAGGTFGPQGALHRAPLRPGGAPGGGPSRGCCCPVRRAARRALPCPASPRRRTGRLPKKGILWLRPPGGAQAATPPTGGHDDQPTIWVTRGGNPGWEFSSVVPHLPPEIEANPEVVWYAGPHRGWVLRAG